MDINKLTIRCPKCFEESIYELPKGQEVVEMKIVAKEYIGEQGAYPCGREMVIEHIKEIGKRLIDNAEKIFDSEIAGQEVKEIEFTGRIAVNELTELEIRKKVNVVNLSRGE